MYDVLGWSLLRSPLLKSNTSFISDESLSGMFEQQISYPRYNIVDLPNPQSDNKQIECPFNNVQLIYG